MERAEIEELLRQRKKLIRLASSFPLSVAKLWTPYCHRWDGFGNESEREIGCGEPMTRKSMNVWECLSCEIVETRSSQREAALSLGQEATLISGGNRAGKTQLGAQIAVAVAAGSNEHWVQSWLRINNLPDDMINPNPSTVWVGALSYKDALEYQRPKLDQYLPVGTKKTRWNSQDRGIVKLPNGGRIVSMSCDAGREAFQGGSASLIWLDEEPPEPVFDECMLRTVDSKGSIIITATPLKGLTWLFDKFVEDPIEGFSRVQISGLDNPYVSSVKMRKVVSHLSEASQRARLYGEFSSQSGLVYPEFNRRIHVVDKFDIPEDWIKHRTIDFGTNHPFCCLWVAVAPSGALASDPVLIIYRELYWTEHTTLESGREILRLSKDESYEWTVADPESKDGRLTLSRELGIRTLAAPKHLGVIEGIGWVKEWLQLDAEGKPKLLIFKECTNLIKEFRLYRWDKNIKHDRPMKQHDHALDSLRYEIMQFKRYNSHM
jgi:phage terminase large subunit-like protein